MRSERGFTLLEALVACAVLAIGAFGMLGAWNSVARSTRAQAGPNETAALEFARRTLRIAEDAWKYGAPGAAPAGTWTVTAPAPMTVSTTLTPDAGGASVAVTVAYTPDPGRNEPATVTVLGEATVLAPLPGSQVAEPGAIPQPSGAP